MKGVRYLPSQQSLLLLICYLPFDGYLYGNTPRVQEWISEIKSNSKPFEGSHQMAEVSGRRPQISYLTLKR